MDIQNIQKLIQDNYDINIKNIEIFRKVPQSNNCTYTVYGADKKYFLKAVNNLEPLDMQTALSSVDIQLYLMQSEAPAIPVIFTKDGSPCIRIEKQDAKYMYIMYEFIHGGEPRSMVKAGEALGKMHNVMKNYPGQLIERGKYFFIDRYLDLMWKHEYPRAEFFSEYGNELWEKAKNLPRGYCHCDLYCGNMHSGKNRKIYVVDFDTSCMAFPVYDIALFCNWTHYFKFDCKGYERTRIRLEKFLPGYQRYNTLSAEEISSVYVMIGIYHFQLCAQQIEREEYNPDAEDNGFLSNTLIFWERQYDWLVRWKEQCLKMNSW